VRFVFESGGMNDYLHFITNEAFRRRFFAVVWVIHAYLITYFSLVLIESELLKKWFIRKHIYLPIAILPFLVLPYGVLFFGVAAGILFIAPSVFNIISVWRSPKRKENPFMHMYLISLVLFLIVGSTSKIFAHDFFMPGIIVNMFLMMTQMILLSRNYTDAFRFVEETNENLEKIVDERTHNLQAANEAMQITNNAMKELVSNISHDLKTPLSVMSVNLESLSSLAVTQSDTDYQRHVRAAYQKNLDLQRLIGNLFEVSRIETGRNLYAPKWESLLHLLVQANEKYNDYIEDHGLTFDINAEDIEISTDTQKIWSVFDNIIYNAVRHTASGGITITAAAATPETATVTLTDTGCGIEPEHLPRVFERFYKASQERSANEGESGLGLYIVKSVMEGCGGSAAIESEPGKGTSVILTFPAKPEGTV
jgi:signal transduction histidine kinase